MRAFVAICLCFLLFGCQQAPGAINGEQERVIQGKVSNCHEVTYETTQCSQVSYNYSYSGLEKLNPYMLGDHCIGGGSITVKNLEKQEGLFIVTFIFETPIEGKVTKTVEREIAPKASALFEEKVQFRCSQEYTADFRVAAPKKQACRVVNETREECQVLPS
ncbi:MAG: hypothetical protein ABIF01_01085 [Candidatus Micrarchaeota archaeon]